MGRKIGSGPCRRTHRYLVSGPRFGRLWARHAGGLGRRVAAGSPPTQPKGHTSDDGPAATGIQPMRIAQIALLRNAEKESVFD